MKKCFKILIVLVFFFFVIMGINNVYAASTTLSSNSSTIDKGETASITVSVTSTEAWNLKLNSSGGFLSGTTSEADSAGSEVSKTVMTANFTANEVGTYTITLTGEITGSDLEKQTISKTVTITVTAPTPEPVVDTNTPAPATKSSNTNLGNLGIEPNDFTGFTASKTDYYVTVPNEVSSINVYAKKTPGEEDKQSISGTGNKSLEVGTNRCIVTVTAENGETKTYNIYVTRKAEETEIIPNVVEEPEELLKLATLEVKNATITPEFNPDVYEYEINLTDTSIEKLDILATANIEKATIEVTGNENFMEGDNTVSIVLKSEDGTKAATYKIVVKKGAATEGIVEENNAENTEQPKEEKKNPLSFINGQNKGMIIILSIAIVVLLASIATVIVIIVKNRKEAKAEIMSFTPSSEYSVFKEKKEKDKNKDEKIENIEEEPKKKKGKHF